MGNFDMGKELREKIADAGQIPVKPGDPDFSVILAIDTRDELVIFASHDRRGQIGVPWDVIASSPPATMTMRQRAQVEKEIQAAMDLYPNSRSSVAIRPMPQHFSEQLQRQINRGQMPGGKSYPTVALDPEPVSETVVEDIPVAKPGESDLVAKLKAQAKNSLAVLAKIGATPDDALSMILSEVIAADEPRKVAGEWITKFTAGITDLLRELEED